MKRKERILLIFTGPSASGKTTIVENFLKTNSDFRKAITCTTRQKRPNEKDGESYYFISDNKYKKYKKRNKFLESDEHFGCSYGLLKKELKREKNKNICIILDSTGTKTLSEKLKNNKHFKVFKIMILPKSKDIIVSRLNERSDKTGIEERLSSYKHELTESKNYDFIILNEYLIESESYLSDIVNQIKKELNGEYNHLYVLGTPVRSFSGRKISEPFLFKVIIDLANVAYLGQIIKFPENLTINDLSNLLGLFNIAISSLEKLKEKYIDINDTITQYNKYTSVYWERETKLIFNFFTAPDDESAKLYIETI